MSNILKDLVRKALKEVESETNELYNVGGGKKCECSCTTIMPDNTESTYKCCCGVGAQCTKNRDCPSKRKKGGKVSKKKTKPKSKKPRGVGVAKRGYGKALTGKKK